jgi:hypothetical protein
LHARQVISGNQWYLHDWELADALDRHRLFEGGGVESEELGSVVEAGLCSAAHLMREAISMQSSRSSAASGFAIRMQSACSAAYGAAVILLSELRGLEGQVADVQYLWGKGAVVSTCMLSELHGLEGQVADVQYLWGKGAVVSTCMHAVRSPMCSTAASTDCSASWSSSSIANTSIALHEAAHHSTSSTPDTCGEVGGAS